MTNDNLESTSLETAATALTKTGLLTKSQATAYLLYSKDSPYQTEKLSLTEINADLEIEVRGKFEEAQKIINEAKQGISILEALLDENHTIPPAASSPLLQLENTANRPIRHQSKSTRHQTLSGPSPKVPAPTVDEFTSPVKTMVMGKIGRSSTWAKDRYFTRLLTEKYSEYDRIYAIDTNSLKNEPKEHFADLPVDEMKNQYNVLGSISTEKSNSEIFSWVSKLHRGPRSVVYHGRTEN